MGTGLRVALLLGAGALALTAAPGAARAQLATLCVNCVPELNQAIRDAQSLGQLIEQVRQMQMQYQQLVQTYQAIAHLPDNTLRQVGGMLNADQFRVPLPTSSSAIAALMNGSNLGSLTGVGQQFLDANRIYQPPSGGFGAAGMAQNAASIAGTMGALNNLYQSATGHVQALQQLEGVLASTPDAKAVADVQARLQMEQAALQAHQVQAQTISAWQQAQVRVTEQQRRESRRCYIDQVLQGLEGGTPVSASTSASDSCAQPAAMQGPGGGSGLGGGTGTQAGTASGYDQYNGQAVGSGQCVALVQAADSSVGLTRTWTQGAAVQGNTSLQPGTPIATFDANGTYGNHTDGSSHAAIYLGQDANGIQVMDQWMGQPAHYRTIRWNSNTAANSGSAFYVINH